MVDPRIANYPRLWLMPASEAPIVAVIRRRPAKRWHILAINTETRQLAPGTWHSGSFYPLQSDVSPNGRMMTCMMGYGLGRGVVSIPEMRWVVRWSDLGSRGEAGFFPSNSEVVMGIGAHRKVFDDGSLRSSVSQISVWDERMRRDGWVTEDKLYRSKPNPEAPELRMIPADRWRSTSSTSALWLKAGTTASTIPSFGLATTRGRICSFR